MTKRLAAVALCLLASASNANPPGTYNPVLASTTACSPSVTVAFDAKATAATTASAATTISNANLTVGSGTNRALIAQISFTTQGITNLACNWDAAGTPQAMTRIVASNTAGANGRAELWGLVAPTSGNKTLTCSWTGAADAKLEALSYTNVDQTGGTTSFPHSTSATGTSVTPAVTVTSSTKNAAVDNVAANNNLSAPTQTQTYLDNSLGVTSGGSRVTTPAASVAFSWTQLTGLAWADVGTDVQSACP